MNLNKRAYLSFSLNRVYAIVLRHYYLSLHQLDRIFSIFFYPTMALILWGFLSAYVARIESSQLAGFLLGGLILWVIFENVNTELGVSFMFDVWERNLINLLASPVTFAEYLSGLIISGIVKILVALVLMGLLASAFYDFKITSLGFGLALFWLNLALFALSFGIVNISLVLRFGHTLGPLTWALPFLFQPFAAVFYPVSSLPPFFQGIAFVLPISHVFEGMRTVLASEAFDFGEFWLAFGLNIFYLLLSVAFFAWIVKSVKKSGHLVKLV